LKSWCWPVNHDTVISRFIATITQLGAELSTARENVRLTCLIVYE
jgi:hypothetical protein